ncbi:MAG: asparagine synthase (glutamine-hydrolyzing), partial [Desulfovibrio sp.]|nr:asparagine synthase (glutamine-hydrolyzing) [Desulfovibrio sp.]
NKLKEKGACFRTNSDTEVILESYRLFGADCLDLFEGMFAFALYDQKTGQLFLARDRFGKKPLFYTFQQGFFCFASELSALKAVPWLKFRLSERAIVRYLAYEYVPEPETIYENIQSLAPAHFLQVSRGLAPQERYWNLPSPVEEERPISELTEELRFLLDQAVQRRLISDVPLGVFLSGGVDSSIVTAFMASHASTVKTFSIGFSEASYDESRYARLIAERFATDHHEAILSQDQCSDLLPTIVQKMDLPMADASMAPTYLLSKLTRQHVTVALGGDGSDELWAGYENYAACKIAMSYHSWPKWLRRGFFEPIFALLPSSQGYVNLQLALQTFLKGVYAPEWLRVQKLLTSLGLDLLPKVLSRDFQDRIKTTLQEEELFSSTRLEFEHWPAKTNVKALARYFHVYLRQYLPSDILFKVDRCSMLNSLEVRAPFLDRDLAEFTARLPLRYKFYQLKGKKLLRKAMEPLLPKSILYRNKRGFQIPVAAWLRGRLKPLLLDMLSPKVLEAQGIFDPKGVRELMTEHFQGLKDRRKQLWTLLVLQLWLEAQAKGSSF